MALKNSEKNSYKGNFLNLIKNIHTQKTIASILINGKILGVLPERSGEKQRSCGLIQHHTGSSSQGKSKTKLKGQRDKRH
jgi:hypothetical protein